MNKPLPNHLLSEPAPPAPADQPAARAAPAASQLGWLSGMLALLLLGALAWAGLQVLQLPAAPSAGQPSAAFSAARAMAHLEQIAQRPHPTGSPENAAVRSYLLAQLQTLGLAAEVQDGLGAHPSEQWARVGRVHNIVARLPGQGTTGAKALLLMAHYDSVPTGPGAADNGASVAALLETLRALRSGPALRNDVIVLLSDGEEPGMLGAELFARAHPWRGQVGLVLNFEFRGNAGPLLMFETSAGNAPLVAAYAAASPAPTSNSLLYELYRLLPNDTDLSTFKRAGLPAMNFAAIEHPAAYHTQRDVPSALGRRTLQHEGDTMLAMVRHFGARPLDGLQAGDSIYFNLPGLGLLHYPAGLAWPLCLLAGGLFALAAVRAGKLGLARRGRVIGAAVVYLLAAVALAAACELMWLLATAVHDEYRWFVDPPNSGWYFLAAAAFALAGFCKLAQALQRWFGRAEMSLGALAVAMLLLAACCAGAPGISYLLAWSLLPLLAVQAWLWRQPGRADTGRAAWLLLAAAAPAMLLFAPVLRLMHVGLGAQMLAASAFAVLLLCGLLHPLLARLTRPLLLPLLPALLGLACLAGGALTRHPDANHPALTNLFYALDAGSGKAFWLSRDDRLDSWNRQVFPPNQPQRPVPEIFGAKSSRFWAAEAPALPGLQAPRAELVSDSSVAGRRSVVLRIASQRPVHNLVLVSEGAALIEARAGGLRLSGPQKQQWRLSAFGLGSDALTVELTLAAGQPFELRVFDESYGLPPLPLPPRGAGWMATPYGSNGDTVRAVRALAFQ